VVQQLALVLGAVAPVQALLDVHMAVLRGVDLHPLRLAHDARGQRLDARRKGGAEHHGLAPGGGEAVDFGQVVGKAEVEHAVGLIDHQKLHLIEHQLAAALQIEQAARRGHHEVGVLQFGDLHLVGHAADHVGNAQATAVLHQVDGVVGHLLRQLARRAQHQRTRNGGLEVARQQRVLALGALGRGLAGRSGLGLQALPFGALGGLLLLHLHQQGVQHRQQEGRGFAAAGLARDHQVGEGVAARARAAFGLHGFGDHGLLHQVGWVKPRSATALSSGWARPNAAKAEGVVGVATGVAVAGVAASMAAGLQVMSVMSFVHAHCGRKGTKTEGRPAVTGCAGAPDSFVVKKHIDHKQIGPEDSARLVGSATRLGLAGARQPPLESQAAGSHCWPPDQALA